jgi:hypothetical protein
MSFQHEHGILVASPAAYEQPPPSSRWLVESCRRQGIELTLLGQGKAYPDHRCKVRLVADYLRDHPEYRYVLQVDFRDVIFCAGIREIFYKYKYFCRSIVASAERTCWPMPSHAALCPETGTVNRYLNAGVIFARSEAWLEVWDLMRRKERMMGGLPPELNRIGRHIFNDDQAAWTDLYIHREADIALDAGCLLFLNLAHADLNLGTKNRDLKLEGRRVLNRETGTRPCLIHCSGSVPVDPWGRYVLEPPVTWVWPLIDQVRTEPLSRLAAPQNIERLLLDLGLHEPVGDDVPDRLLPFSGKGLAIRRRPSEFAPWLGWLANGPPIGSYVEVGVGGGGAFVATVELLRRFHTPILAIGVGTGTPEVLLDYVRRTADARFVRGARAVDGLRGVVERGGHVDLTLIDADRPDGDARADWEYARACSRYVAIHGITRDEPSGAASLWEEIRATHRRTREFIDRSLPPASRAGLGVVDLAYEDG